MNQFLGSLHPGLQPSPNAPCDCRYWPTWLVYFWRFSCRPSCRYASFTEMACDVALVLRKHMVVSKESTLAESTQQITCTIKNLYIQHHKSIENIGCRKTPFRSTQGLVVVPIISAPSTKHDTSTALCR